MDRAMIRAPQGKGRDSSTSASATAVRRLRTGLIVKAFFEIRHRMSLCGVRVLPAFLFLFYLSIATRTPLPEYIPCDALRLPTFLALEC
jgi:hypothetical protein